MVKAICTEAIARAACDWAWMSPNPVVLVTVREK